MRPVVPIRLGRRRMTQSWVRFKSIEATSRSLIVRSVQARPLWALAYAVILGFALGLTFAPDNQAAAGWAQALGGAGAVLATWGLARRDERRRLNDRASHRTTVADASERFCREGTNMLGNFCASLKPQQVDIERGFYPSAPFDDWAQLISSLPLLDLENVDAYMAVIKVRNSVFDASYRRVTVFDMYRKQHITFDQVMSAFQHDFRRAQSGYLELRLALKL